MDFGNRKINKLMQYASNINAQHIVVIGDNEIESRQIELKDMASGEKEKLSLDDLVRVLCKKKDIRSQENHV
jgi:histidyl-tRNA synthetase